MAIAVYGCGNDRAKRPRNYPDRNSAQAQLYIDKCGQCHAAPLPNVHTAKIWPSVLDRMQMNMTTKHVAPLTRVEMSIILGYLQQHAKRPTQQTNQQSIQQPSDQPLQQKQGGN
ncbi:MAG: hypothetical protein PVJ72_07300 [Gammaproteobacteria bacterium]|jgi:hypothetical protein